MTKEICRECNGPTYRAGRDDDSLYCERESCEVGPFCEECYVTHLAACEIASLRAKLAEAEETIRSNGIDDLWKCVRLAEAQRNQMRERADAAEARVKELEAALRPFAAFEFSPNSVFLNAGPESFVLVVWKDGKETDRGIRMSDFARARALLAPPAETPKPCATCGGTFRAWTEELGTIACPMCRKEGGA